MSTLNEFIASIKTNGIMPLNRYEVDFALPKTIASTFNGDLQTVHLHCERVTIPGMAISTQQARTYGEFREMPYERTFDNVNMTFLVDTTMDTKRLFDSWINSIQDPGTRQFNYYRDYTTDLTVKVLDKNETQVYYVKLFECYPKSIGSIQMDYSSRDIMTLDVNMQYRYWVTGSSAEDINGTNNNTLEALNSPGNLTNISPFDDTAISPNLDVDTVRNFPQF